MFVNDKNKEKIGKIIGISMVIFIGVVFSGFGIWIFIRYGKKKGKELVEENK